MSVSIRINPASLRFGKTFSFSRVVDARDIELIKQVREIPSYAGFFPPRLVNIEFVYERFVKIHGIGFFDIDEREYFVLSQLIASKDRVRLSISDKLETITFDAEKI